MHEVETMAYNKVEVPWHGLGVPVEGDLTPDQMMEKAGLNWTVRLEPTYISINKKRIFTGDNALVRESDNKILDTVSGVWELRQNKQAFDFFNEFVAEGHMNMETAGSLRGGRLVWALARINESFELFNGKDKIDSYLLFTNPFLYGWSTSVSWSAIRVVCQNTLMASLTGTAKDKIVRISHRRELIESQVKESLGISKKKLQTYKETANFLASKPAKNEDIVEYFKRVFPVLSTKDDPRKEISKSAKKLLEILPTQPGVELGEGSWWQPYNAVTYFTDHVASKTADVRLSSAWYGEMRKKKIKALDLAVEFANAS